MSKDSKVIIWIIFFKFDHDGKSTFWEDQENNLFPLEGKTIPAILQ